MKIRMNNPALTKRFGDLVLEFSIVLFDDLNDEEYAQQEARIAEHRAQLVNCINSALKEFHASVSDVTDN